MTEIRMRIANCHRGEPQIVWTWTPEEAVRLGAPDYHATHGHLHIGDFDMAFDLAAMETLANLLLTEVANRRDAIARAREAARAVA
jgi:hypothetical protein